MLTNDELHIYKMLILGYPVSVISRILKKPQKNIKGTMISIFDKLGVSNRVQLIIKYNIDYNLVI